MKSFTMVLLATAALALPALAEQRDQGQMTGNKQQGRTHQDRAWRGEQSGQTRSRIEAAGLNPGQIRKIQRALKDAGHKVGGVDGKWGPNTRQALKDFQEDKGMAATGRLNRRVISALGFDPQRFAAGNAADSYAREDAYRAPGSRELSSGSERRHHYGYGGGGRDYGYSGRDRDHDYSGRDRSRNDDYTPRRGERY